MPKKKRRAIQKTNNGVRQVRMYPVYARKDVRDGEINPGAVPMTFLDSAAKAVWIEQGAVRSTNRGQVLYLLINLAPSVQRSQAMGPGVIEGNADNNYFAQQITNAWRVPTFAERAGAAA